MKHADALSRNCGILIIEENSVERNLQILQGLDEKIEVIKQKLELSEDKLFELNNGLIIGNKEKICCFMCQNPWNIILLVTAIMSWVIKVLTKPWNM
jgi:hypothetical protein